MGGGIDAAAHLQEGMDHSLETLMADSDTGFRQSPGIGISFVPQRIGAAGDEQGAGQIG